jgi:hypothetical protein
MTFKDAMAPSLALSAIFHIVPMSAVNTIVSHVSCVRFAAQRSHFVAPQACRLFQRPTLPVDFASEIALFSMTALVVMQTDGVLGLQQSSEWELY